MKSAPPATVYDYQVFTKPINQIKSIKIVTPKKPNPIVMHTHKILRGKIIESIWEAYSIKSRRFYYAFCMADGQIIITISGFIKRETITEGIIGKVISSRASKHLKFSNKRFWSIRTENGGILQLTPSRFIRIQLQSVTRLDGRRNWKPL
jgi:hypothetical protein